MNEGRGVSALGPPAKELHRVSTTTFLRGSGSADVSQCRAGLDASAESQLNNRLFRRQAEHLERTHLAGLRALGIGDVAPSRRSSPRLASQLASMRVPRDPHHEQRPSVRRIS